MDVAVSLLGPEKVNVKLKHVIISSIFHHWTGESFSPFVISMHAVNITRK